MKFAPLDTFSRLRTVSLMTRSVSVAGEQRLIALVLRPADVALVMILDEYLPRAHRLAVAIGGAPLEAKGPDDDTPLIIAAINDDAVAGQILIDAGADVNAINKVGKSPLA